MCKKREEGLKCKKSSSSWGDFDDGCRRRKERRIQFFNTITFERKGSEGREKGKIEGKRKLLVCLRSGGMKETSKLFFSSPSHFFSSFLVFSSATFRSEFFSCLRFLSRSSAYAVTTLTQFSEKVLPQLLSEESKKRKKGRKMLIISLQR